MYDVILRQLIELAKSCHRAGIKPIICGGMGVYLSFYGRQSEIQQMIRATHDIDLMLSREDLLEEAKRRAIADIITKDLKYVAHEDKKHHGFVREDDRELDILVPPIEELSSNNYRTTIVKSTLHGHITKEAEFIDEGLRPIPLSLFSDEPDDKAIKVYVPSPTNLMIMKLHAFSDRYGSDRNDADRAMAHAWDIYIAIMLTGLSDYKEGQSFLTKHNESDIIIKSKIIVRKEFSVFEKAGWQVVLQSPNFYPNLNRQQREEKINEAAARLRRWFNVSNSKSIASVPPAP